MVRPSVQCQTGCVDFGVNVPNVPDWVSNDRRAGRLPTVYLRNGHRVFPTTVDMSQSQLLEQNPILLFLLRFQVLPYRVV